MYHLCSATVGVQHHKLIIQDIWIEAVLRRLNSGEILYDHNKRTHVSIKISPPFHGIDKKQSPYLIIMQTGLMLTSEFHM